MGPLLRELASWVDFTCGGGTVSRIYVDTGPVLERDAADRAGLGFIGRNTMLIDPARGSWSLLGVIITDAPLDVGDEVGSLGTCGRCTRCITACPTGAISADYEVDSRTCLSYLTIENRGPIPYPLRPKMGNLVFGCDICNDVCPYNKRALRLGSMADEGRSSPDEVAGGGADTGAWDPSPPLVDLLALDDAGFARRYDGTAVSRAKRKGLLRNACVAAGNWGSDEAIPALSPLLGDVEPLVRGHAAWALAEIGGAEAQSLLERAARHEPDGSVRDELTRALAGA
jgi:epoxyqueuosine reductase